MSEHHTPVNIAIAFTEAWTGHDMTTASTYVANDVVFEGPLTHAVGVTDCMNGLAQFAEVVTGLATLTALGDANRTIVMYEITTGPFWRLRAADEFLITEGKITHDTLVFDTHAIRSARASRSSGG
jgi:hypothetical protein